MTADEFSARSRANAIAKRNEYLDWRESINLHIDRAAKERWNAFNDKLLWLDPLALRRWADGKVVNE